MNDVQFFNAGFKALTGHAPLRWQRRLFSAFLGKQIPDGVDLPTGLGKTSVIAIWLIALAAQTANGPPSLPRRLVYVVDRRTVVDQATDTAERMRNALCAATEDPLVAEMRERLRSLCLAPEDDATPLAISTLRGEHADNREWQADPARPAIIVGTVDMIGSRLLFEGYGVSRRMRPFHAGLLGHDTLLVHDEAHLSPAFGELVRDITALQRDRRAIRPLRVLELSATQRKEVPDQERPAVLFALDDADRADAEVKQRISATKKLRFESTPDDLQAALSAMAQRALDYEDERTRILIYIKSPKEAKSITDVLIGKVGEESVAVLTGTIRGYERDRLAKSSIFRAFKSNPAQEKRELLPKTLYLVATSAGEVGVDLDADHLVCDLAPLDSMIQRLGRVNRLGRGAATVHVFEISRKAPKDEDSAQANLIAATKEALQSLSSRDEGLDVSPEALRGLLARTDAFSKPPRRVPLTDILLDKWALTRVENLPGRPSVARWLHGIEGDRPQLHVAWRAEADELAEAGPRVLKTLYDKHPIHSRERLRGPLGEVLAELKKLAKRKAGQDSEEPGLAVSAILIPASGDPVQGTLSDLLENEAQLPEATIVLPPAVGGLDERGMLDAGASFRPAMDYDVADVVVNSQSQPDGSATAPERARVLLTWNSEAERWSVRQLGSTDCADLAAAATDARSHREAARRVLMYFRGMAQKALLVLGLNDEGEPTKLLQLLAAVRIVGTVQDDPAAAPKEQELTEHLDWARDHAEQIVHKSGLIAKSPSVAEAVVLAARLHDLGKNRAGWQKAIGHPPPRNAQDSASDWKPWAKSGRRGFDDSACGSYRHEFGSVREATDDPAVRDHPERDLILHLIAAHHGWARPHFEPEQWDIADGVTEEGNATVAADTMRRFAKAQRRFGHWGLAWLEALMRSADYAASERIPDDPGETRGDPHRANVAARDARDDGARGDVA